jgi:DNA-directed RNA polymerase subunit RPC12/RpoP
MNVYKCDFCGKVFDELVLAVDLPPSFYDDVIDDVNANRGKGVRPTTMAKLAKKAGHVYLGVGLQGDPPGNSSYHACPRCFGKMLQKNAKCK